MARPDDSALRFPCPHCFRRLRAPNAQGGTRRRCPFCQFVFKVPAESRGLKPGESYDVHKITDRLPAADPTTISITCPVCAGRMYAEEDQVGHEVACPDCETPVVVPSPDDARKAPGHGEVTVLPSDGYALVEEVGGAESQRSRRAADATYIPVTCRVCDTLMKVTEDQVGHEIVCPDCQVPTIVEAPAKKPAVGKGSADLSTVGQGEYAVDGAPRLSAGASAPRRPTLIAVVCIRCDTRLHATEDQVGEDIVCPDCDMSMVVPPPAAKRRSDPQDTTVGEYDIQGETRAPAAQRQPLIPVVCILCGTQTHATEDQAGREVPCPDCDRPIVVPPPPPRPRADAPPENTPEEVTDAHEVGKAEETPEHEGTITSRGRHWRWEEAEAETAALTKPPRWLFFSGVFHFPVYRRSWSRWVVMSLVGVFALLPLIGALGAIAHGNATTWFTAAAFFTTGLMLGVMWLMCASVTLLTILGDTAHGYDEVQNWPEGPFVDWITDAFFVINALALSAAPVAGPAFVTGSAALLSGPYLSISVLVLFPIILLSMLEANSCMTPFSLTTVRALMAAWRAWGLFYLVTTPLVVAGAWLTWSLIGRIPTALAAPFVAVAVAMIYFRLLGRLAYGCSKATAEREPQSDDSPEE